MICLSLTGTTALKRRTEQPTIRRSAETTYDRTYREVHQTKYSQAHSERWNNHSYRLCCYRFDDDTLNCTTDGLKHTSHTFSALDDALVASSSETAIDKQRPSALEKN